MQFSMQPGTKLTGRSRDVVLFNLPRHNSLQPCDLPWLASTRDIFGHRTESTHNGLAGVIDGNIEAQKGPLQHVL